MGERRLRKLQRTVIAGAARGSLKVVRQALRCATGKHNLNNGGENYRRPCRGEDCCLSSEDSDFVENSSYQGPRPHKRRNSVASSKTTIRHRLSVQEVVNCYDEDGLSPLHHAISANYEKLVKYLISLGAHVDARDARGNTPAHIAARHGMISMVTFLGELGADLDVENDEGRTPLEILGMKLEAVEEKLEEEGEEEREKQEWNRRLAEEWSDDGGVWWGSNWPDGKDDQEEDWSDVYDYMESRQDRSSRGSRREYFERKMKKPKETKENCETKPTRYPETKLEATISDDKLLQAQIIEASQNYARCWKSFSESCNMCLGYSDMPYPVEEGKESTLLGVLLHGVPPRLQKDVLRKEILRWHPDKFLQKWGSKLHGPDHDRIVDRLNGISQAIHELYRNYDPKK